MRTSVDSDEERYGAPFDPRRRPQARDPIELADLAPEVREWRRHDMEDAVSLRRRNVGHTSPSSGSAGTLGGVDRASVSSITPRPSGTAVVHEPTRPQEASTRLFPYTPYRPKARGSTPTSTASTRSSPSPVGATPIATGAATTSIRTPPASRFPASPIPRVERHNIDTGAPTHVIADPDDYSPISGSANTTAPGTPHMASNSILRGSQLYPQLQQQAVVEPTSGSMLFSRDGQGLGDHIGQEQQGTQERRTVVGPTGASTDEAARASPVHTDLSSLLTSPPLRPLPSMSSPTTPLAPVPVRGPLAHIRVLEGSNASAPRGPTVVQVERTSPAIHRPTGNSPSSTSLASFQTAPTPLASPPHSPSSPVPSSGPGLGRSGSGVLGESLDTLTTPVQATYSHSHSSSPIHRIPVYPNLPSESPLVSGYIPSLSQTYHPQDLDYERGVVLLSPPSSRSESPFSVVSNTGSPTSRSPALSIGTNYMSLDGSVDGRDRSTGFGRSPLVPQHTSSSAGPRSGPGSPTQFATHSTIPPFNSPPSSITFDDSDFDLLSASNSPYSTSPFASPHIGTIRHSPVAAPVSNINANANANATSPPMLFSPSHSHSHSRSNSGPHSPTTNINIIHGSPALQRATSPTTSTTSTSISDIDFLDDDDSFGFNSDGWASDHNQPSRR
ncbi:hypothetical protein MD484_g5241, partial [Candolleomyces efflorescens]